MNLLLMKLFLFCFFFNLKNFVCYGYDQFRLEVSVGVIMNKINVQDFWGSLNVRIYECFVWFKKMNFWINIIYEIIMLIKFLDFGCFKMILSNFSCI